MSALVPLDSRMKALLSKITAVEKIFYFTYTSHISKYSDIYYRLQKSRLFYGASTQF